MSRADAYKRWRKSYIAFKWSVQVLEKLGTLEIMCQRIRDSTPPDEWEKPDWTSDYWKNALYNDIVAGQVSPLVLNGLIRSCPWGWWEKPSPSAEATIRGIEMLYRRHGKEFRARHEVSILRGERIEDMGKPTTGDGGIPAQELPRVRQELGDTGNSTARAEVPT
jgi:hypothetical protein